MSGCACATLFIRRHVSRLTFNIQVSPLWVFTGDHEAAAVG